jgi:hypothetical protein
LNKWISRGIARVNSANRKAGYRKCMLCKVMCKCADVQMCR